MSDVPSSIYNTIGKNVIHFKQKAFLLPLYVLFLHMPDLASASSRQENDGWEIYTNARFQYQICYPSRLLKPQGEPDNGDGQKFLASDGSELTVFGGYNDILHWTLEYTLKAYSADLVGHNGKITYQVIKKDWAVFSGDDGEKTEFYGKIFIRNNQFYIFKLTYKKQYKNQYSKIVAIISKCFTPRI